MTLNPATVFAPLLGQSQAVELLTQAVIRDRLAPAYLFAGADGVGRSLAAHCFIELLFSHSTAIPGKTRSPRLQQQNHPDLLWVEPSYLHQGQRLSAAEAAAAGVKRKAPPQIRIEQIREISRFLSRPPLEASRSVVVIEQAETMAEAAANGLLKTLEEPGQATLILLAGGGESLLPTLVSRCQRIPFYRLPSTVMAEVLTQVGREEILQHPQVLAIAQGSPGAAIASWHQLQNIPADLLQALTHLPQSSLREALDLARQIDQALDTEAQLWVVDYLQHGYWQIGNRRSQSLHFLERAKQSLRAYAQPRLVWEVTFMALCAAG
ncbi:DNA polymerase III subunit delta' [Neosynechococcus sphagnicola sy1]|uniref:DNA polymerase III subunit delta n=1 Tax=Neosynechococcus sphagnicola sy1 TaxID=1497020 RepID=A0A098TJH8_9CYAN|nr:DNA polymerase III subunit delta' [Neosynechococcus sphagnicola sy1]